jgi:hypothetical protein
MLINRRLPKPVACRLHAGQAWLGAGPVIGSAAPASQRSDLAFAGMLRALFEIAPPGARMRRRRSRQRIESIRSSG